MTTPHGLIDQSSLGRKDDSLFRVSLKGLIQNEQGEVLVVKETGRDWWDLPGGGMDFGEGIKDALARELAEEVSIQGDFSYRIIDVDEPGVLNSANVWQIRLVFTVTPMVFEFSEGDDGDEIAFIAPELFRESETAAERRIYEYCQKLK